LDEFSGPIQEAAKADSRQSRSSSHTISPHFGHPRSTYRDPKIQVTLPKVKNVESGYVPLIQGATTVRVDMNEEEKSTITGRQTEVYFFLDGTFLVEKAPIKIPCDFQLDFSRIKEGDHILTVNLVTDNDQVGVSSKAISIRTNQTKRLQ
jgi:hypothetical protein